jgi:hypothetical protein
MGWPSAGAIDFDGVVIAGVIDFDGVVIPGVIGARWGGHRPEQSTSMG